MRRHLIPLTLAALVLAAVGASAQVEPAPYLIIHYDRIDPAHMQAWEQNGKDWVEAYAAAGVGAEMGWRAYVSNFGYAWVSDMPDYAFLDGQQARNEKLEKMLGEGKMEELDDAGAPAIVEHYNEIWKYQPEMSYMPAGFDLAGMRAITVATVSVKSGMGEEYRELVKEVVAAFTKSEASANWFAYSTPFGAGSYAYVIWGKDRGDLHSGPDMGDLLTKAVGEEKSAEMFASYMKCVAGEETRDWMVRADLSFTGAAKMETKEEGEKGGG